MSYTQVVLLKDARCCPSGGTGRRTGLKILRDLTLVPVQVRPWAPFKNNERIVRSFFCSKSNKKRKTTIRFSLYTRRSITEVFPSTKKIHSCLLDFFCLQSYNRNF